MKKKLFLIIIVVLSLSCCNCSNEIDPDYYPSFDGINGDENTLYFVNRSNDEIHKIYAVDTKNKKKVYTYEFNRKKFTNVIYDLVYDSSFDINPYCVFMNGDALKLDVSLGKFIKFDIDYYAGSLSIVDNDLWVIPDTFGLDNKPVDYFIYEPQKNCSKSVSIPEGRFYGSCCILDNNYYLPIEIGDFKYCKIYNLTKKNIFKFYISEEKYDYYWFICNNYIFASYLDSIKFDVYFLNSFEPKLDYKYLFSINTDELVFATMFEDENYIYLISREYIIKRNKNNNYDVEKTIRFNNKDSFGFYCKNGYIWLTSEDNDGAYKVNMDDLSCEIIK